MDTRTILARQQVLNQQQHKRLARRIHDDISQKMTLLSLQLSLAASDDAPPPNWAKDCKGWADMVMELSQSIREIMGELQPRIADQNGLISALRWLTQSCKKVSCAFTGPNELVIMPAVEANELLSICRDVVMEIILPGGGTEAEIQLDQKDGFVRLHFHATRNGQAEQIFSEKAVEAIGLQDRLICFEGTFCLTPLDDGASSLTLSVPSAQAALAEKAA